MLLTVFMIFSVVACGQAEELSSEELMAKIISVSATSALEEKGTTHAPEFVIDGDLMTGWVEGAT